MPAAAFDSAPATPPVAAPAAILQLAERVGAERAGAARDEQQTEVRAIIVLADGQVEGNRVIATPQCQRQSVIDAFVSRIASMKLR